MERPSIISPRDESFLVRFLTRLNAIKRGKRLYSLNAENKGRGCKFVIFSLFFFFEIIQGIIQRKEGRKEGRKRQLRRGLINAQTFLSRQIFPFLLPSFGGETVFMERRDLSYR